MIRNYQNPKAEEAFEKRIAFPEKIPFFFTYGQPDGSKLMVSGII